MKGEAYLALQGYFRNAEKDQVDVSNTAVWRAKRRLRIWIGLKLQIVATPADLFANFAGGKDDLS